MDEQLNKKYKDARMIHNLTMQSMKDYFDNNRKEYFDKTSEYLLRVIKSLKSKNFAAFSYSFDTNEEITYLIKLFIYYPFDGEQSINNLFVKKELYGTEQKKNMLDSITNNYLGLFQLLHGNKDNNIVTLKDKFTNKTFDVYDTNLANALRSTYGESEKNDFYILANVFSYNDILFLDNSIFLLRNDPKVKLFIDETKQNKYDSLQIAVYAYGIKPKH